MGEWLSDIAAFIAAHRDWAGPLTGLACFVLSLTVVGILIPAPPLLFALGGLIGAGLIDPVAVVGCAIVGTVLAYAISYIAGRWLGHGFLYRWPLKKHRRAVARSRLLFRRYASLAVFASRFFGPVRVTIPMVAGILGMSPHRFHLANILSALIWAPIFMAPGWVAAKGIAELESLTEATWLAVTAGGLLLLTVIAAIGFRLQRARLVRRRARVETRGMARR